jgi:regulator of protease activity HflC (stomatin/prohibitin superfamily)
VNAKQAIVALVLVTIGGFLAVRACVAKVAVGEVGVRVVNYDLPGMKKGVEPKDYGPGWGWDLGPLHRWVIFDGTVQTLELADTPVEPGKRRSPAVRPRTSEGYQLEVDVTVKYQIVPGEAHLLYEQFGADPQRYHDQVAKLAEATVREVFGDLKTADFYNPKIKREQAAKAKEQLARELADAHVQVIDVLIRNVTFPENYENLILQKKVADLDVAVNQAREQARTAEQDAETIEAQTKAQVSVIEQERDAEKARRLAANQKEIAQIDAEAEAYATTARADADLVAAKRRAEGVKLLKEAEAEGVRLKNEAMGAAGGWALVALEAAKNLQIESAEVSTAQVDLFDIDRMLERFGLSRAAAPPAPR